MFRLANRIRSRQLSKRSVCPSSSSSRYLTNLHALQWRGLSCCQLGADSGRVCSIFGPLLALAKSTMLQLFCRILPTRMGPRKRIVSAACSLLCSRLNLRLRLLQRCHLWYSSCNSRYSHSHCRRSVLLWRQDQEERRTTSLLSSNARTLRLFCSRLECCCT